MLHTPNSGRELGLNRCISRRVGGQANKAAVFRDFLGGLSQVLEVGTSGKAVLAADTDKVALTSPVAGGASTTSLGSCFQPFSASLKTTCSFRQPLQVYQDLDNLLFCHGDSLSVLASSSRVSAPL
ncbi:hypothetical protein AOLI_G00239700 [Acnodon oligacanthus]